MGKYLSISELSTMWGISERRIRTLCASGQIKGAYKVGKTWLIPPKAEKPLDGRSTKVGSRYIFPALPYTKYFLDETGLNIEELSLSNVYKQYLACNYEEATKEAENLFQKSSYEHVRVGSAYMLSHLYICLNQKQNLLNAMAYLKRKATTESLHKADYYLLYMNALIVTGKFSVDAVNNDILNQISKDALAFSSVYNISMMIPKCYKGENPDILIQEANLKFIQYVSNPISEFYYHSVLSFLYLRTREFEKRNFHIHETIKIGLKYKFYTLFSKVVMIVGPTLFVELKKADPRVAEFVINKHLKVMSSSKSIQESNPAASKINLVKLEHIEILSLISNGLTNNEISKALNISSNEVQKRLENIYIDLNIESKNELKQFMSELFNNSSVDVQ